MIFGLSRAVSSFLSWGDGPSSPWWQQTVLFVVCWIALSAVLGSAGLVLAIILAVVTGGSITF